jgi:hypothetical protein
MISPVEACKRWRDKHRARSRESSRRWRQLNREKARAGGRRADIKRKYGLSVEEYEAYLQEPCAICGLDSEVLDHCHVTRQIRLALCHNCNHGLGKFKDNPALLRTAADYLELFH